VNRPHKLIVDLNKPLYINFDNRELETINPYYTSDYCDYNLFSEIKQDYFLRDTSRVKNVFKSLSTSRFKLFFRDLSIDTPSILNKTPSLRRNQNSTDFGKLAICLARRGKKIQATNLISKAIFSSFVELKNNFLPVSPIFNLKLLYYYFTTLNISTEKELLSLFYNLSHFKLDLENTISESFLIKSDDFTPEFFYKNSMKKFNLLFSFYIYKVDKNIYKNSRGKSGKYSFVWKYVPAYKRATLVSHWLMKEVRISPGKNIQTRVNFIIRKFLIFTKETLAWKINKFSTSHVYYHLRKSLGETCRTTMK